MQMKDFSICFQNSQELLNPLLTVGEQLFEVLKKRIWKNDIKAEILKLLKKSRAKRRHTV